MSGMLYQQREHSQYEAPSKNNPLLIGGTKVNNAKLIEIEVFCFLSMYITGVNIENLHNRISATVNKQIINNTLIIINFSRVFFFGGGGNFANVY